MRRLRDRVAAEKKQVKAAALAAKKIQQAARKRLTIQRRVLPKRSNREQATLDSSGTLDAYLGIRKEPLSEGSNGSESVSSPPLSEADGGLPNLAPVRQGKVQPPRKSAHKCV